VDKKIDLRIGPALDTLNELLNKAEEGTFDFAFIDADKGNYCHYYEACVKVSEKLFRFRLKTVFQLSDD
jgi:predicted O-methyltransferase YrrM